MLRWVSIGLVLLIISLPLILGQIFIHQFYRLDEKIQQNTPLRLIGSNSHKDWQYSQVDRSYRIDSDQNLTMQHQLRHAWFPLQTLNIQTQIQPNLSLSQQITNRLGLLQNQKIDHFKLNTDINSFSDIQGTYQYANHLTGHFQYKNNQLRLKHQLPQLTLQQSQLTNIQQQLHWQASHLQTQINIEKIDRLVGDQLWQDLHLKNTHINLALEKNGTQLWDYQTDINSLTLQQGDINLGQFKLAMTGQRLHQGVIKQAITLAQASPLQQKLMMPMFLLQYAPIFLRHAPSLNLSHFSLTSPLGQLQLTASIETNQQKTLNLFNSYAFLQKLHFKLDLELTGQWLNWLKNPVQVQKSALIYQTVHLLRQLQQKKWLTIKNNKAVMHLQFKSGQWYF